MFFFDFAVKIFPMKKLIPLLFAITITTNSSAQSWSTMNVELAARYDDVFFLNDTLGWACNSSGNIQKTSNGGQTWSFVNVENDNYLRCIEFMDADTGFCGGFYNGKYFYKTTNGGQTWQNISTTIPGLSQGICGISCPGEKMVYGCGIWAEPAYIIKSADGGVNWQKIDMSQYASALVDILFISRDTGWVSGRAPQNGGGIILHTTDGGLTWETAHNTNVHGDYVWKLQRLDPQHWFASIERDWIAGAKTEILKSSDGLTWNTRLVKNTYFRLQAIGFINQNHGWTGDQNVFETVDGGETWFNSSFIGLGINRFFKINAQKGIMSGAKLYLYNTTETSANEAKTEPRELHKLSVSPNPTNGDFQISIGLKQKTNVILKVYSFDGKWEQELWTGEHESGDYLLQVGLAGKPAGTYVVYMKTHHGAQTATVIKQ